MLVDHRSVVVNNLIRMGNDVGEIVNAEEGEISDSASIEEITAEDFNKPDSVKPMKEEKSTPPVKSKSETRVWTMQDLFSKYPTSRGYATGLYNFAWAQAVQNKPLNEVYVMDDVVVGSSEASSSSDKVINLDSGDELDAKMEDGELEEGEIDMDSDTDEKTLAARGDGVLNDELEQDVNLIRRALESVSIAEADKSFHGVCSRLQNTLESLQVVLTNILPTKDVLIQLAFSGIQAVHSVFCSLDYNQKNQNKEIFSRLISVVISQDPPIFSSERLKKIEAMIPAPNVQAVLLSEEGQNKEKQNSMHDGHNHHDSALSVCNSGQRLNDANMLGLDSIDDELSLNKSDLNMLPEASKPGLYFFRARGAVAPLLDLHKDHDSDSLPSPTRENQPCFLLQKSLTVGDGMPKPESFTPFKSVAIEQAMPKTDFFVASKPESVIATTVHKMVDAPMTHFYEIEAVKAVSTYQQKFGRASFFSNDLPSPTPSEESAEKKDDDMVGEVSSSSTLTNFKNTNSPISVKPITYQAPYRNSLITADIDHVSSVPNPTLKATAKSRDPRIRFATSNAGTSNIDQRPLPVVSNGPKVDSFGGTVRSRREKTDEEPLLDGPAYKRQKNDPRNHLMMEATSNDPKKMEAVVQQLPVTQASSISTTSNFPALLKDFAGNPTLLLNILKLGQEQKLASEAQERLVDPTINKMHPPISKSLRGMVSFPNISSLKPLAHGQNPMGVLLSPSPGVPTDDVAKMRMKPRDPRRFLHSNTVHNSTKPLETNGGPTMSSNGCKEIINAQKLEPHTDTNSSSSQSVTQPDIARQFTTNLKNIADIVNFPQTMVQPTSDKVNARDINTESEERLTSKAASKPRDGVSGPLKSQHTWRDVEHLYDGLDDQQKAKQELVFDKERARRLEEQNKMFAAHKLCLVLDLDHTLLNSAKFTEVDLMHDEILRKKEEQDREKPQRHLFRFPYMGMWTKLRPGVWNFLEKASKLFEMHLYTMGNKLYATEMAKILDPKGELFAGRVISRGDEGDLSDGDDRVPKSKDLEGVLGMESSVVIIDDSIRVWPHHKPNLIVVERYTYFPCSRRQFGLLGPSLLEIDHDERPEDGTLASCSAVIEKLHQSFFSSSPLEEVDVRHILESEQKKILSGCRILFSRVIPVAETKPHLYPLWQTAEQFGAVCTNQIDEQVTHVVANSLGTDKVNWALSTGRFVVSPGWVEASALLYRRVNEKDFAIKQ